MNEQLYLSIMEQWEIEDIIEGFRAQEKLSREKEMNSTMNEPGENHMRLEIIEAIEGRGYVLQWEAEIKDNNWETQYVPIEETSDEFDTMRRLLECVAEFFGFPYDKYSRTNINITFDKLGRKVE